jgi:hypothetical protein
MGRLVKGDITTPFKNVKELRHRIDRQIVKIQNYWDFYFDILSQRRNIYNSFLKRCDGVVGECYNLIFNRLEKQNPWTKSPPLCYIEKASSPATLRRGVLMFKKTNLFVANPFPIIKIPYDRVPIPWTLTSLLHEVSHNIHGDIPNLWQRTKLQIYKTLRKKGFPKEVARTWSFWHKETLADLLGILFGGPAVALSLMDLLSRPHHMITSYRYNASHPNPYLRVFISAFALKRLGFTEEAKRMERQWKLRYPLTKGYKIPEVILRTAPKVIPIVVNTLLWNPYEVLGNRKLVDLVSYSKKTHHKVLAGSRELVKGRKIWTLPKRLIISSGVYAFKQRPDLARVIRQTLLKSLNGKRISTTVVTPSIIKKIRVPAKKKKNIVVHRISHKWPRKKRIVIVRRRPKLRPRKLRVLRRRRRLPAVLRKRPRLIIPKRGRIIRRRRPVILRKRSRSLIPKKKRRVRTRLKANKLIGNL